MYDDVGEGDQLPLHEESGEGDGKGEGDDTKDEKSI